MDALLSEVKRKVAGGADFSKPEKIATARKANTPSLWLVSAVSPVQNERKVGATLHDASASPTAASRSLARSLRCITRMCWDAAMRLARDHVRDRAALCRAQLYGRRVGPS